MQGLEQLWRRLLKTTPVEWVFYEVDGALGRGSFDDPPSFAWRLPRGPKVTSLTQLERELELLRQVPTIRGIVVRLSRLHCSGAVRGELRRLLYAFRASGREVVLHADQLSMHEYWLASVANRVWLSPRGRLELTGFSASATAAARPLGRLGLVFHVVRAGVFKSAGELLGSERVSDEARLQLDELVGDLYALFVDEVAKGRALSPDVVRGLVDNGPYTARRALDAGLVDALLYADELREKLDALSPGVPRGERARIGPFAAVLATHSPPQDWKPLVDTRPLVAVLDMEGLISTGQSRTLPFVAASAGSDTLVAQLHRLRRDRRVRAVVLRIDSRGGSALASDLIWRAASRLAETKPVVAFLDSVAASGGYYVAAAARRIVAAPTCVTGSIGVFTLRPDASGALRKADVDRVSVRRGARAGLYDASEPLRDEDRQAVHREIRETYDDFMATVAQGRGLSAERVRSLAEGRVYLAGRAAEAGLVDRVGTLLDAVDEVCSLAQISGPVRLQWHRSRQAGWRALWRSTQGGGRAVFSRGPEPDRVEALWLGHVST